jgi:hypothetical protein
MSKTIEPILAQLVPEKQTDFSPCPYCNATEVRAEESDTIHWAQWRCVGCDSHRGWIEHPHNAAKRESQNQLIDKILDCGSLNGWESLFCRSVKETKKRSPKQIQKLRQMASRIGIATDEDGGEL